MLGWLAGRTLRSNAVADIRRVQKLNADAQIQIARELAKNMAFVERIGFIHGNESAFYAARDMLQRATRDRQQVGIDGGPGSLGDPRWLLASLTEAWASAKVASLSRSITFRAFRRVDLEMFKFIGETIPAGEIAEIIEEMEADAREWTRG